MPNINNNPVLIAMIFAAVAMGMIFFAVFPLAADIKEAASRIGVQRGEIADYDFRIANARKFMLFSKSQSYGLEKAEGVFADSRMPLDLINSIEAAAEISDVAIEFLPSLPQDPLDGWPFVKIEINASGAVPAILRFVERMENGRYLMEIESVDIGLSGVAGDFGLSKVFAVSPKAHILSKVYAKLQY